MKKKIVFIVHSFDKKYVGGVLKIIADLSNSLINNYDVTICSLGKIDINAFDLDKRIKLDILELKYYDTRQLKRFSKVLWFYYTYKILRKYFKLFKNETYFVSTSPPLSILFGLLKSNRFTFIACDHTSILYKLPLGLQKLRLYLLKKADFYFALTPIDNEYFNNNGLNSVYVPNFVNKNNIDIEKGKNIIFIGRFSDEKDPILAIRMFADSALYKEGAVLKMYGYGDLELAMINYINERNISSYVQIINNETEPHKMLNNAACLILTSKIEGFGLVLLEAMSLGVPCLAFDAKYGPRFIIKDGINGFLIKDYDEEKFIFYLKKIYKNDFNFDASLIKNSISNYYKKNVLDQWYSILK